MRTGNDNNWGKAAPTGAFKFCLETSQAKQSKAWARLAGWFAPDYTDVERLGFKARLHPKDNLSEKRILLTPERFDPVELAFLSERLHPEFVFMDIGANCGAYTLHLATQAAKGSTFLAIEAQPEMARRFRFNAQANAIDADVILDEVALSDRRGTIEFQINRLNRGESRMGGDGETIVVEALPLLGYLSEKPISHIDAMKIDVEGFEFQILAPFFDNAPETLWPTCLIVEQIFASPETDPVALAQSHGYQIAQDLGRNVILLRDMTD